MSDGRLWTFANFRIRDVLDVDRVSTTYRATTVEGDESRRLRVFADDAADDQWEQVQAAIVAEARRARRVRHPHVLAIHDADRQGDHAYVVSDDIHGAVLRDFIAHHHPLRTSTVLAMAWQLAEALDAVHSSGVVHGGINPHTIWVADSPGRDVPMTYLTGFGAARALARHVSHRNGAPTSDDLLYMEPDQMGDVGASPEADRYALACAVYHLLTGVPPFRRATVSAQLGAHRFATVEPPSSVRDDLPPALDSVFARALAKETSDRYPSASALLIAVERGLRGQREARAPDPGDGDAAFATSADTTAQLAAPAGDGGGAPAVAPASGDARPEAQTAAWPTGTTAGGVDGGDREPGDGDPLAREGTPAMADADDEDDRPAPVDGAAPAVDGAAPVQPPEAADAGGGAVGQQDGPRGDQGRAAANGDGTSAQQMVPLERLRAAAVEADRAGPQPRVDGGPAIAFRPGASADAPQPSGPWHSVRAVIGSRSGLLALAAALLVVVAGTVALVTLDRESGGARQRPVAAADRGRSQQPATVRPLWTAAFAERPVRSIAVSRDALLVDAGTTIGALDPTSGTRLWTERTPGRIADLAVLDGVVAASTVDGIRAYDADSGRSRWRLPAGSGAAAVVAGDETFYAAARDDTGIVLSAIDPRDGVVEPLATIAGGERPGGYALAFGGASKRTGPTLYVLTRATLYAFDPEAGFVRWRAPVRDSGRRESPRLRARPWVHSLGVAAGAALVVDREGMVCRHAAASGEQVWTTCQRYGSELDAAPTLLTGGGRVVVAGSDALATYDFTTGSPLWSRAETDGAQYAVAGGTDLVYVARERGVVSALDHASGRERWRAPDVEDVSSLAADDDGVFAGLADGSVVRLVQRTVGQPDVQ